MIEPVFKAKPGQIDYTHARIAPVINCVVRHKNKILLVQRSSGMKFYPSLWNGISGFLDDERSVEQKTKDEIHEELGIREKDIIKIYEGRIFNAEDQKHNKTWVVHPVLVDVKTDRVVLDWEAQDYKWINPGDINQFELLPCFEDVVLALFPKSK